MEVKCHIQKAKPEDVPKFPSRKEEQTFDCFNKTVIVYYILYYFMQDKNKQLETNMYSANCFKKASKFERICKFLLP